MGQKLQGARKAAFSSLRDASYSNHMDCGGLPGGSPPPVLRPIASVPSGRPLLEEWFAAEAELAGLAKDGSFSSRTSPRGPLAQGAVEAQNAGADRGQVAAGDVAA